MNEILSFPYLALSKHVKEFLDSKNYSTNFAGNFLELELFLIKKLGLRFRSSIAKCFHVHAWSAGDHCTENVSFHGMANSENVFSCQVGGKAKGRASFGCMGKFFHSLFSDIIAAIFLSRHRTGQISVWITLTLS